MTSKIGSIEYMFREGQSFSDESNLRNKRTGDLPDSIELLFSKVDLLDLVQFFKENGYKYSEIMSVKPKFDMVVQRWRNVNNKWVNIPDALDVTFKNSDGRYHTWQINDYSISNVCEITSPGVPFYHETKFEHELQTKWRAHMLAEFGGEYANKLKTQLAFDALNNMEKADLKISNSDKTQNQEMKKIARIAYKNKDLTQAEETSTAIKVFFENQSTR